MLRQHYFHFPPIFIIIKQLEKKLVKLKQEMQIDEESYKAQMESTYSFKPKLLKFISTIEIQPRPIFTQQQ